jgi:hypothetical protein
MPKLWGGLGLGGVGKCTDSTKSLSQSIIQIIVVHTSGVERSLTTIYKSFFPIKWNSPVIENPNLRDIILWQPYMHMDHNVLIIDRFSL